MTGNLKFRKPHSDKFSRICLLRFSTIKRLAYHNSIILAVKCVCQSTLNLTRGRLVIQNYSKTGNILSVEEVNQMEPVIFSCFSKKKIIIGAKFENEENLIPFSDKGKGI